MPTKITAGGLEREVFEKMNSLFARVEDTIKEFEEFVACGVVQPVSDRDRNAVVRCTLQFSPCYDGCTIEGLQKQTRMALSCMKKTRYTLLWREHPCIETGEFWYPGENIYRISWRYAIADIKWPKEA